MRLYGVLWVAEYRKVHRGLRALIASCALSVLSTDCGSSMITIGRAACIYSMGCLPESLSLSLKITLLLLSSSVPDKFFRNASMFIMQIWITRDVANARSRLMRFAS